jgi:glycerol-3-phosphate O-acyltransferase
MPPPKTVVAEIGERRLTAFSGVGISVCEPLDTAAIIAPAGEDKEAAQAALADAAWKAVTAEYQLLEKAITQPAEREGLSQYVQPWKA